MSEFDYQCATSVAPQQLQTATVQIRHPDSITADKHHVYCMVPHMVVWADRDAKPVRQTCFAEKPNPQPKEPYISGISLEPIVDGHLAASNPHSTAKTAVAVGGVVSVAITEDQRGDLKMKVGNWLTVNFGKLFAEFDMGSKGKAYAPAPEASDEHPKDFNYGSLGSESKVRYIGLIVDTSELATEHYVRVKLI